MFCYKCGKPLENDAAFCTNCGAPVKSAAPAAPSYVPAQEYAPAPAYAPAQEYTPAPTYAPVQEYAPTPAYAPAQKYAPTPASSSAPAKAPMDPAKKKKVILFSAIGAGVLAVVIILLLVLGGGSGYSSAEDAAKALVVARYNYDVEGLVKCLPDFYIRYMGTMFGLDENASRQDVINMIHQNMEKEETYDDFRVLSAHVSEEADESVYSYVRARRGYFSFMSDKDLADLGEIKEVTVTYFIGGEEEYDYISCIEINGVWYAIP